MVKTKCIIRINQIVSFNCAFLFRCLVGITYDGNNNCIANVCKR